MPQSLRITSIHHHHHHFPPTTTSHCPSTAADEIATHRVLNPSHSKGAVTLHVYSPPYQECKCFDEGSGRARPSGKITFFSRGGEKCQEEWESGLAGDCE